jgi:hypothetical protein
MTASELAFHYRNRFQAIEADGRKTGFENMRHGIIEHSDAYEVVGCVAQQSDPQGFYDSVALRISFITFPGPCVDFRLHWTSWMADPSMKIRANCPPVIVKEKCLGDLQDGGIQQQGDRFISLLATEVARGKMPGFVERLWIRFAK